MKEMNQPKSYYVQTRLLVLVISIIHILFGGTNVYAEEVPISVHPILPENQLMKEAGFYDLLVTPGQEQELSFEIQNHGEKAVTLNLVIHSAATGDNGVIDYTRAATKKDESKVYSLPEVVKVDTTVSVPGKEKVTVPIKVIAPKESFKGKILGAIRVTVADEKKKEKKDAGISITNKFAYVVAIQLQNDQEPVKENVTLKGVFASQIAGRNTVKAQLQNPSPTLIDEVEYKATITKKGRSEILQENKAKGYRIAPNTTFHFPIPWGNQRFKEGTYELNLQMESKKSGGKWTFIQDFKINAEEARKLNETAVDLEEGPPWLLYGLVGIGSILLLLLVGGSLYLIVRKRQRKAQALLQKKKQQKKNKRKKKGS